MTETEIQSLKAKAEQAHEAVQAFSALCRNPPIEMAALEAAESAKYLTDEAFRDEATPDAILRLLALVEQREKLMTLAREAANGWACYAKRKIELDDIGRIHQALDALRALQPPKE